MEQNTKPQPIDLGGKYLFTLSSYDPVEVEVFVPFISEDDVQMALQSLLDEMEETPEVIDDEWVAAHLEDVSSVEELISTIRRQLEEYRQEMVEDQKRELCIETLVSRLEQSLPQAEINSLKLLLEEDLEADLKAQGITREEFSKDLTGDAHLINDVLFDNARMIVAQKSALSAYANKKHIEATEDELSQLLGIPEEELESFVSEAKKHNALDQVLENAMHVKAMHEIFSDAKVTFILETEEQAKERALHSDCCGCAGHHHLHHDDCSCSSDCGCEEGSDCTCDDACDCGCQDGEPCTCNCDDTCECGCQDDEACSCSCDENCECGCQEGKPCTCNDTCICDDACDCGCQDGEPCTCNCNDTCTCDDACDCGCQDGEACTCTCDESCECGCQEGKPCTCTESECSCTDCDCS